MNHDIFISYSSKNLETANIVCQALEECGIKCWIAPRDIPSSSDYGDLIDEAILSCKLFLFIYSYDSLNSVWCKGELNLAFCNKKIILPYCIDSTPMKGAVRVILNQYQLFEAHSDDKSNFVDLVNAAAKALGKAEYKSNENQAIKPITEQEQTPNIKHKSALRYSYLGIVPIVVVAIVLMVAYIFNINSSNEDPMLYPIPVEAPKIVQEDLKVVKVIAEDTKPVKEVDSILLKDTKGIEVNESIGFTTSKATSQWPSKNIAQSNDIGKITIDSPQTEYVPEQKEYHIVPKTDKKECKDSKMPNNEIWYTTNDGKIIKPRGTREKEPFDVKIISNTYSNNMGIISFEGDVTTIRDWAFMSCNNLISIIIPESVMTIEADAFNGCTSLKEFKGKYAADNGRCLIKDNTIVAYAFDSGSEFIVPNEVKTIESWTFYNCDNLKKIILPDSLTTIGFVSFASCDSLTTITIPPTVRTIRGGAFEQCKSLTSVYLMPETPPIDPGYIGDVFKQHAPGRKIYVPINSVDIYKKTYSRYAENIVGYDFNY